MKKTGSILSISCDNYEKLRNLSCTKADATTIRESLLKGGDLYQRELAFQLDSPTCSEIRDFFPKHGTDLRGCPVFTIFFSGHGGVHNGNFYLCPSDYLPEFPSSRGISISELIRYARDLEINTLNIVIDSCQSGQSGADLREAIEKPAKEQDSSLCISIIASCLPDQTSITGDTLSAFTKSLNEFIVGVRDSLVARSVLTLGDISQLIPDIPHRSGRRQTVVHYSLNVLGPAHFCVNPLTDGKQRQPHNVLLSPHSTLGTSVFEAKESLEKVYASIGSSFQHQLLIDAVRPICNSASSDLCDLDELLRHYSDWLGARAATVPDWSLPLRISASLTVAALSAGLHDELFLRSRVFAIVKSLTADLKVFRKVVASNDLEALQLLTSAGLNSFYFAPIRLSHCYARMGLCLLAGSLGYLKSAEVFDLVFQLSSLIEKSVPNLHLLLNEAQAPHLGIFFGACAVTNKPELAEASFGRYLADHDLVNGKVLRDGCEAEQILKYLRHRAEDPNMIEYSGIALPNTTLPILMICAKQLGFEELIDPYLVCWNRLNTSIFIPQTTASFGCEIMNDGINVTRAVGSDFYTVAQYCSEVESEHTSDFDRVPFLSDRGFIKCVASYLFPDRFPWIF